MTETAKAYGGSLYDLAAEDGLTDIIREQMLQIRDLFSENPEYMGVLCEFSISKKERIDLIEQAFGGQAERYLVSFMKLLCEHGIMREFTGCCEEYVQRYNADHNIAEAVVTSAEPLNDAQTKALVEKLEKMSGKTIELTQKVDPSVIGGLRVVIEGKQLDGTVEGRIRGIFKKLNEVVI